MIAHLHGTVAGVSPDGAVIDVGGVGLRVQCTPDTLATLKQQIGPQTVNHYGQLPAVTVSFGLAPGASLGNMLKQVDQVTASTVPEAIVVKLTPSSGQSSKSLNSVAVVAGSTLIVTVATPLSAAPSLAL